MRRLFHPLALILLLAGCTNPRGEALDELQRLDEAMQQHALHHGSFPETLDPRLPATATNLPYAHGAGTTLRLLGLSPERYAATASSGSWLCGAQVGRGEKLQPNCTPGIDEPAVGRTTAETPSAPLQGIFQDPELEPADSGAAGGTRP